MNKLAITFISIIYLSLGALPMFWPLPQTTNAAVPATQDPNAAGNGQDSAAMLNQYLQQQQVQNQQKAQQQQQANANNTQNTKVVWPWWTKVFAASVVVNSIVVFFALAFSMAALWKWLALKR